MRYHCPHGQTYKTGCLRNTLSLCLGSQIPAKGVGWRHPRTIDRSAVRKNSRDGWGNYGPGYPAGPCTPVWYIPTYVRPAPDYARIEGIHCIYVEKGIPSSQESAAEYVDRSYYVGTAGNVSAQTIQRYIDEQKGR